MSKGLLYDATMCIGWKQCEQACAQQNNLPYDDAIAGEAVQSEHKFTVVMTKGDLAANHNKRKSGFIAFANPAERSSFGIIALRRSRRC